MVNPNRQRIFSYLKLHPDLDNTAKSIAIALNLTVGQVRHHLDDLCYMELIYFKRKKLPDRYGVERTNCVYHLGKKPQDDDTESRTTKFRPLFPSYVRN